MSALAQADSTTIVQMFLAAMFGTALATPRIFYGWRNEILSHGLFCIGSAGAVHAIYAVSPSLDPAIAAAEIVTAASPLCLATALRPRLREPRLLLPAALLCAVAAGAFCGAGNVDLGGLLCVTGTSAIWYVISMINA